MEIKLKPCPFCGGKGRVRRFKDGYRIVCAECGASSHYVFIQPWHDSKAVAQCQAAKAWNCRAQAAERMNNAPLTMAELQEMNGEPVYAVTTAGSTWALVDVQEDKSVLIWSGEGCSLDAEMVFLDGYLCRYKPREVT